MSGLYLVKIQIHENQREMYFSRGSVTWTPYAVRATALQAGEVVNVLADYIRTSQIAKFTIEQQTTEQALQQLAKGIE